jgi:translocator protein
MLKLKSSFSPLVQFFGFIVCFVVTFAAAAIGAWASVGAADFYASLSVPTWAPPGWLFGPVWSFLYFLMSVSVWLVWRAVGIRQARIALSLFIAQLAANALWSWLFFAWYMGAAAFVEVLILWLLIGATLVAFWKVDKLAAVLLMPYLAWVTFAAALTYASWTLNPDILS